MSRSARSTAAARGVTSTSTGFGKTPAMVKRLPSVGVCVSRSCVRTLSAIGEGFCAAGFGAEVQARIERGRTSHESRITNRDSSVADRKCLTFRWCRLRPRCKERGGGDVVTSLTTSDAADRPQPGPARRVAAANRHLLRCRSSTMSRIACVAAPRICRFGACNERQGIFGPLHSPAGQES